jgi:aminoglycoside 3-N-acetyltransferase I
MSTPFAIQALTSTDLKTLRAMLSMFGHAFEDPEHFDSRPPSDDYLCGLLQAEFFVAIAALLRVT